MNMNEYGEGREEGKEGTDGRSNGYEWIWGGEGGRKRKKEWMDVRMDTNEYEEI